jgi:hypothetical protein
VKLRNHSGVMLALAIACGGTNDVCVIPPCVQSFAIAASVRSATGQTIPTAFVQELDSLGTVIQTTNCGNDSCRVGDGPGTYHLHIGAPGFTGRDTTVIVTAGDRRPCSCQLINTQEIAMTLIVVPPPGI